MTSTRVSCVSTAGRGERTSTTGGNNAADTALLPGELSSFVGRPHLLAEGARLIQTARVVTLVGTGGVGKSRLLVRLAHQIHDTSDTACVLVHLADVPEGGDRLPSVIVRALRLREDSPASTEDMLVEYLRSRRVLLLLDNCEHLVGDRPGSGPLPQLLRKLLAAAPGLRVLATSLVRLGVDGEHQLTVPPLCTGAEESADPGGLTQVHEALKLLIVRARAAGVEITEDDYPVANRLCRLLDGLPLAIELAASQLDVVSLQSIVDEPDLLALLVDGASEQPHHRTLRAMLQWQQQLLTETEQRMWAIVSVFEGGFDLAAAQAVCAPHGIDGLATQRLLAQLVRKSLLMIDHRGGTTRYRMLHVIRQYGLELLAQTGQAGEVHQAHAAYYSGEVEQATREAFSFGEVEWLHRLVTELPNLHAAQRYYLAMPGQRRHALRLAINLVRTHCHTFAGVLNDARRMLMLALQGADETLTPQETVGGMSMLVWISLIQGDYALARTLLTQATEIARAAGISDTYVPLQFATANVTYLAEPDLDRARDAIPMLAEVEAAISREGNAGDTFQVALCKASATATLGEPDDAIAECDRILAISRAAGAEWAIARALWIRALAELIHGNAHRAIQLAQESVKLQNRIGDIWGPIWGMWLIASAASKIGDHERAARLFGVARGAHSASTTTVPAWPYIQVHRTAETTCRRAIGNDRFDQVVGEGKALPLEAGLELALTPVERMHCTRDREELLSPREFEIAQHVAAGKRNLTIAQELKISRRTVETHMQNILRKLGLTNRGELAAWYHGPTPVRASA